MDVWAYLRVDGSRAETAEAHLELHQVLPLDHALVVGVTLDLVLCLFVFLDFTNSKVRLVISEIPYITTHNKQTAPVICR